MHTKSIDVPAFFDELVDKETGVSQIIEKMMESDPEAVRDMLYKQYHENDLYDGIKKAVISIAESRMGF
jgi:F0F1-type ATP synthase gamma subunit